MTPENRLRTEISTAEMERRWAALRAEMEANHLDAIVVQNSQDWLGGYVRWLTDVPATNGYPRTVLFYRDAGMTVIEMGEFGGTRQLSGIHEQHRGVDRILTTPSFFSIGYTNHYDTDLVIADLMRSGASRIGVVTPGALPSALIDGVRKLAATEVSDATDILDVLKAIKSTEEIALIHRVAQLQDDVFAAVSGYIRPGLRDIDVANFAQAEAHRLGSDQGIFLGTSAPLGIASRFAGRHFQGRVLQSGEHFSLLIEINGPGGMYLEIARTMVLGRASEDLLSSFETVRKAQDHTLSLIRPGARPADIAAAHDVWLQERGLPPERRLYAHGQGHDMVERPLIRKDETMPLAAGMCLAVHPGYDDGSVFAVICDNYLVEAGGVSACLHRTEKKIFEL